VAPLADASLVAVARATPERVTRALRAGGVRVRKA
jgi:hypothetical protein